MKRNCLLFISLILLLCTLTMQAFAVSPVNVTGNYVGVSSYPCIMDDRAGAEYVNNLHIQFVNSLYSDFYSCNYLYRNLTATASNFYSAASQSGTIFAYSGHGHAGTYHNSFHPYHGATTCSYASQENTQFKSKYVIAYSCNHLTYSNQTALENIYKTFQGMRTYCGFASSMYLDSREGVLLGLNLSQEDFVTDAFIAAAAYYQPQLKSSSVKARVMGYADAEYETLFSTVGAAPSWNQSNKDSFCTFITRKIQSSENTI